MYCVAAAKRRRCKKPAVHLITGSATQERQVLYSDVVMMRLQTFRPIHVAAPERWKKILVFVVLFVPMAAEPFLEQQTSHNVVYISCYLRLRSSGARRRLQRITQRLTIYYIYDAVHATPPELAIAPADITHVARTTIRP